MTTNDDFNDEIGNNHIASNDQTPLRKDAFEKTDEEKMELIKTLNYPILISALVHMQLQQISMAMAIQISSC